MDRSQVRNCSATLKEPSHKTHRSAIGLRCIRRVLRAKLRDARTYEEWKEAAIEMDEHLGFDVWKSGK
jgi:hypothetical protein